MSHAPHQTHDFRAGIDAGLHDTTLRANFRRAMDGLMTKRAKQFEDPQEWTRLRALGQEIRQRALSKLPDLLERLEENCTRNGIHVHWAEDVAQANAIILGILQQRGITTVVKGKSMVSEEMHLNAFLGGHGIRALEADLGEYIIQLAGQMPCHIVMPAIHLNKTQIADLFADKLGTSPDGQDAEALTAIAREKLREEFRTAGAGISGVNFPVAETGTLCLIENEGNGRMVTTVPPVHIAVTGIEKVVENLEDVTPLLRLLTRSATGQPITTYVNMISGPRRGADQDGPQEVHLVLIDFGRSRVYADPETRQTLQCIRCAACMNHCPVYVRVGGHAYGGVYPGPIGKILTPQLNGLAEYPDHPSASSLCNACVEVCPVKIPIAQMLVRLRNEKAGKGTGAVQDAGSGGSLIEDVAWKAWATTYSSPLAYRVASAAMTAVGNALPASAPLLKAWTSVRTKPRFAPQSLHRTLKDMGVADE